jgi:hypothetical protein
MAKLVYKKPAHIELIRHSDSARFLGFGVVQSVDVSLNVKTATLEDGFSDYDLVFSQGMDGSITVNLNSFQPKLYAGLSGATFTENSSYAIRHIIESRIPSSAPYTIDVKNEGTPATDPVPVVHDATDSPYVNVSSTPTTGQFSVSGSVFTFSSADAGQEVVLAFDVSETGDKMELPAQSTRSVFQMVLAGEAVLAEDEGTIKHDSMIFDSVAPTGDLKPPTRSKTPGGWSFTMAMQKPRAGRKPVDYRVAR